MRTVARRVRFPDGGRLAQGRSSSLRLALATLAVLLAVAALAACGGGSGDATTTGAGQAPTAADDRGLPGADRPVITLGTRTSLEHILLGQLYKQALEAKGFRVRLKQNISSTRTAEQALRNGEIDAYPEYLGVWEREVARDDTRHYDLRSALAAARSHAAFRGSTLLNPTRFQQVEAIAVARRLAERRRLKTIGDLREVDNLRLGGRPEHWSSPVGLSGLEQVYGIYDVDFAPLTDGLQYPALNDGRLDAAIVRVTDGELADGDHVLLRDPLRLFGIEPVVPVVATRALRAAGPELARTLNAVSVALTTRAMQKMNAATTIARRSPEDVARDFLREHDLA